MTEVKRGLGAVQKVSKADGEHSQDTATTTSGLSEERYKLKDLPESKKVIQKALSDKLKKRVLQSNNDLAPTYYKWFNKKEFENALLSTDMIRESNLTAEIVAVICSYIHIVQWSESEMYTTQDDIANVIKNQEICIFNSADDNISYVNVFGQFDDDDDGDEMSATAFLNELIDIEEKSDNFVYRYVIKLNEFVTNYDLSEVMEVGVGFGISTGSVDLTKSMVGWDETGLSFSWFASGGTSCFVYKSSTHKDVSENCNIPEMLVDIPNDMKSLLLVEIDLKNWVFTVLGDAFGPDKEYVECDIPKSLRTEIMKNKQFRVATSSYVRIDEDCVDSDSTASIACGLVKINV